MILVFLPLWSLSLAGPGWGTVRDHRSGVDGIGFCGLWLFRPIGPQVAVVSAHSLAIRYHRCPGYGGTKPAPAVTGTKKRLRTTSRNMAAQPLVPAMIIALVIYYRWSAFMLIVRVVAIVSSINAIHGPVLEERFSGLGVRFFSGWNTCVESVDCLG